MSDPSLPVRVILVEDHPVVRAGISKMLVGVEGIELVGEAVNGEDAVRLVEQLRPDVILLDIEMPGMNGIEVTRILRDKHSAVKILILSGYEEKMYIRELFQLGASGYLTKDEAQESIIDAIRGVAGGATGWVSRRVASQLAGMMQIESSQPDHLTQRELEVLMRIVDGKTNQNIGLDLKISEKTVEKYIENIFRKMGVRSRVEAAVTAVRQDMVSKE